MQQFRPWLPFEPVPIGRRSAAWCHASSQTLHRAGALTGSAKEPVATTHFPTPLKDGRVGEIFTSTLSPTSKKCDEKCVAKAKETGHPIGTEFDRQRSRQKMQPDWCNTVGRGSVTLMSHLSVVDTQGLALWARMLTGKDRDFDVGTLPPADNIKEHKPETTHKFHEDKIRLW